MAKGRRRIVSTRIGYLQQKRFRHAETWHSPAHPLFWRTRLRASLWHAAVVVALASCCVALPAFSMGEDPSVTMLRHPLPRLDWQPAPGAALPNHPMLGPSQQLNPGAPRWRQLVLPEGRSGAGGPRANRSEEMGVSYGDNYLEDVIESGKRVRWATRHGDLKLYIEQRPTGVRGFEAGYPNLVMQAMQAWLKSLSGQLNVTTTTDPAEAHIRVTWTAQFREGDRQSEGPHREYLAGWTRPVIQNEQLRRMEVQLATLDPQGQPHPAATIYLTALHELGHALGLRGHSPHPEDVMATVPRQQGQRTALSLRDVRTIRRLYDEPADITQLPPGQSLAQRTRPSLANQRQQESILDQQIAAMARQAQQKAPNAWFHLGGLYTSKANLFPEGSNQQKLWLEKATEAFTYSSQTDFRPSLAYANRALLNERMGQPGHALRDMATAIRLSPKEADFYLQQARMLIKAGQPAEARNALSTFLLYEPAGRSDPTYQRLSKHLAQ